MRKLSHTTKKLISIIIFLGILASQAYIWYPYFELRKLCNNNECLCLYWEAQKNLSTSKMYFLKKLVERDTLKEYLTANMLDTDNDIAKVLKDATFICP